MNDTVEIGGLVLSAEEVRQARAVLEGAREIMSAVRFSEPVTP